MKSALHQLFLSVTEKGSAAPATTINLGKLVLVSPNNLKHVGEVWGNPTKLNTKTKMNILGEVLSEVQSSIQPYFYLRAVESHQLHRLSRKQKGASF